MWREFFLENEQNTMLTTKLATESDAILYEFELSSQRTQDPLEIYVISSLFFCLAFGTHLKITAFEN